VSDIANLDTGALASEAVRAFDEGRPAAQLRERHPDWNAAFVTAIRAAKERYRGSKDLERLLLITSKLLYGRDIHWAMELVQNAEDAGARRMVFVFHDDRVLVWNDGEPFRAADVWAICSAGHSAKRNKIGFFGIGFKSVYKITEAPEIYSGCYALRIEEQLYPVALPARKNMRRGAWFVLPLLHEQQAHVVSMLERIASNDFAQVLLTLSNLTEIRVVDRTGSGLSGRFMRRPLRADYSRGWDECEIGGTWTASPLGKWRRFFYETDPVPSGISREGRSVEQGDRSRVILARPLDNSRHDFRIHCFLPTATTSQLRWVVQGDFEPNASREQLLQSDWNEWLMGEVGVALTRAVVTSAQRLGQQPWDLVPLDDEVTDEQQRVAYTVAADRLRASPFLRTRRGWRAPSGSTWGYYPGVKEAVTERDLQIASGRDVSCIEDGVLGPISGQTRSRAEDVLEDLGSHSIGLTDLAKLFAADDAAFDQMDRSAEWWLAALGLFANHGASNHLVAIASSRCIPVRGGGRVRPSPSVDSEGYVVAFSRSDLTADLNEYLGDSQVFLVADFFSQSKSKGDPEIADPGVKDAVRRMLELSPFGVAREAGPFHVVWNLVVPRLNALAALESISDEQAEHAWRLIEYVRQKWPSYVSEYKRWRTVRATDDTIAKDLGSKLGVVCVTRAGSRKKRQVRSVLTTYVSSSLLGWDGMDVVLGDIDGVSSIDDIHALPLQVKSRGRGGRNRGDAPDVVAFLRMLGAPVGPIVAPASLIQLTPRHFPWVDWTDVPWRAQRRVGLENNWVSADVAQLARRWPTLGGRARSRRGAALLRCIEADWDRLESSAQATAVYFYRTWTQLSPAGSSWVGQLALLPFIKSAAGDMERPIDLVIDTTPNRLILGGAGAGVLGMRPSRPEALSTLGVRERPDVETIIQRLSDSRAIDTQFNPSDLLVVARACYQTLADHLRSGAASNAKGELGEILRSRFRGSAVRGLIYAPPPEGVGGERWWPARRVVHDDAAKWVGPYVGQLAGRYPRSALLWETLNVGRFLTVEMATDVIARDLSIDTDEERAVEYYGRIVAFVEGQAPAGQAGDTPAYTTDGWRPANEAWWSAHKWIREAFAIDISWWQPSSRDPSSHRRASTYLGIREVPSPSNRGPLTARWQASHPEPLELDDESRWQLAVQSWPQVLREDAEPAQWSAIDLLRESLVDLKPLISRELRVRLRFQTTTQTHGSTIEARVMLRNKKYVLGRSIDDLFSTDAAEEVASLASIHQRAWGRQLALLLSMAAHDPERLYETAARHAVVGYQHREFDFNPDDFDDQTDAAAAKRVPARAKSTKSVRDRDTKTQPLADPNRYTLESISPAKSAPPMAKTASGVVKLRAPRTGESGKDSSKTPTPPEPQPRHTNTAVEAAAGPYIEMYESLRGCTVVRQGPLVGADYVASDGRYIEVKAFGEAASDSFEMEPAEWRAAQTDGISHRYWIYVVEHLRDGQPPKITAIHNPVLDEATIKDQLGKIRVRGWRSSSRKFEGKIIDRDSTGEDE
jgi:hypothetical protein